MWFKRKNSFPEFLRLSRDLQLLVMSFLPVDDILMLSQASKGMYGCCNSAILWQNMVQRDLASRSSALEKYLNDLHATPVEDKGSSWKAKYIAGYRQLLRMRRKYHMV